MKRKNKLLLLLLTFAAVLTGALLLKKSSAMQEETVTESFTVFSADTENLTSLSWDIGEGKIRFLLEDEVWVYSEDDSFPADQSFFEAMTEALTEVTSDKKIENVTDYAQYGLDEPVLSLTVEDGRETLLTIGSATSFDGDFYLSVGDGNVYLTDSTLYDAFWYGLYDLLEEEEIPVMSTVEQISVTTGESSLTVVNRDGEGLSYSDEYVWYAETERGLSPLDTLNTDSLIAVFTGLEWEGCADYAPDASEMSDYGFDGESTVILSYTDSSGDASSFTLKIGGSDGRGCRYVRLPGSDIIYLADEETLSSALSVGYEDLMPDEAVIISSSVSGFDVTVDGVTYTFEKTVTEVTDEEGTVTEQTLWLYNGNAADGAGIISSLNALSGEGAVAVSPSSEIEISFLFRFEDDRVPEVDFTVWRVDGSTCLTSVGDGEIQTLVPREDIVAIREAVNAIVLG